MLSADRSLSRCAAASGPSSLTAFHRQARIALDEHVERSLAIALDEVREDLGEIGRVLLLEQVHQVRGGPHAEQPLHRIEDDVEFALDTHGPDHSRRCAPCVTAGGP